MARREKIYTLTDFTEDYQNSLNVIDQVTMVAIYCLQEMSAFTPDSAKSCVELYEKYLSFFYDGKIHIDINQKTFTTYLCLLAKDSNSLICSARKFVQKNGYFLDDRLVQILYNIKLSNTKLTKLKERDLYPVLKDWLKGRGFMSADISSKRSGEAWCNPDLLGVQQHQLWGESVLDIVTIEVKSSLEQWQKYIFEAISHARFANKSYFAFLRRDYDKIPDEIKLYAQKFGIGLISITLSYEKWLKSCEDKQKINKDDFSVDLILPTPHHVVDPLLQIDFMNKLGITSMDGFLKMYPQ